MHTHKLSRRSALVATLAGFAEGGWAQTQPGVMKIIVPFPPGGVADPVARGVAARLSVSLGRSVIVDNKAGASTIIATSELARAAPDGATIGVVAGPFVLNPVLRPSLPYETLRDFAPITRYVAMPLVLAVHPSVPVTNIREFVALVKSKPDLATLAVSSIGTFGDIATRQFVKHHDLKVVVVPYKGGGQMMTDLVGGQVKATFDTYGTVQAQAQAGKLRIIAVLSKTRLAVLPQVETMAEAGYADFDYSGFFGFVAPGGTTPATVSALATAINNLTSEEKQGLIQQGFQLTPESPSQFATSLRSDIARWRKAVSELGIPLQN